MGFGAYVVIVALLVSVTHSISQSTTKNQDCVWNLTLGNDTYKVEFDKLEGKNYTLTTSTSTNNKISDANGSLVWEYDISFSFCGNNLKCDGEDAAIILNSTVVSGNKSYAGCLAYAKWENVTIDVTLNQHPFYFLINSTQKGSPSALGKSVCANTSSEGSWLTWTVTNNSVAKSEATAQKDAGNQAEGQDMSCLVNVSMMNSGNEIPSNLLRDITKIIKKVNDDDTDDYKEGTVGELIILLSIMGACVIGTIVLSCVCCRDPHKNKKKYGRMPH